MKRLFMGIFLLSFYLNTSALNESCFEYIWTTDVPQNEIFLLNTDKNIDFARIEDAELYMKLYKSESNKLDYDLDIASNDKTSLQDNIASTYYDFYVWSDKKNSLSLDFKKVVWPWINPMISIESSMYNYSISVSKDNINYENININNLSTFSFRYLKINFISYLRNQVSENIKIRDLIFTTNNYIYLVKWNEWKTAKFYSNFYCSNWKDYGDLEKYNNNNLNEEWNLVYKTGFKNINLTFLKNITYSIDKWTDSDLDWVNDNEDNCKNEYNPTQLDTNTNWIWDMCDDDDSDWIIGKIDNCPYNSNTDQKDINNNKIWDLCEFDKDKDGFFDSLDNCVNNANPNQKDIDNDNIWDLCDNCKLYNPTQIDKNNNNIWDTCEETEKFEKENDKDKDTILDYIDNCKDVSNKWQEDSDLDSIWDVCDNCKDIRNTSQEDIDKNWVGDLCEDSDNDGILWYIDNCINQANSDQKDSDNNWVWDMCEDYDNDTVLTFSDNCPYEYNVDQKDIDNDWRGDVCDKKDDRYIESNKTFFIWLLIVIVSAFASWIFFMIRKLQNVKK